MNAQAILEQIENGTDLRLFINKEQLKYIREHCGKDMPAPKKKEAKQKEIAPEEDNLPVENTPEPTPASSRARRTRKS